MPDVSCAALSRLPSSEAAFGAIPIAVWIFEAETTGENQPEIAGHLKPCGLHYENQVRGMAQNCARLGPKNSL